MDYLDLLNERQKEAVLATDGPLMIIAGAGSGKTRVLTYRIAHLIHNGVEPYQIMALTFTNKAAKEMRERIESVVGHEARNIWMGTFHSIFGKILRIEGSRIGFSSDFSIYDTNDSKSLIKSIVKELNLDPKLYKASTVYNRISAAKNKLVSHQTYLNNPVYQEDDAAHQRPEIGKIYKIYHQRCFRANAMDFDDLLFNTNVLFRDHPEALHKYQHKFRYIMVDEFQDTNISQYLITKKLSALHQNICVVGDDAQSIYAFRGADIQNILNFKEHYPALKVIRLEQNYRSTKCIVNAANSVINHNQGQLRKEVWTDNEEGELINILATNTESIEARVIAQDILDTKMSKQANGDQFAILYRTNSQSRSFEEALRRLDINYKVIGGLSFYQRKEIKDFVSYLRYTINHEDEEAFKRIINLPKRGIGATTVAKIRIVANEKKLTLWQTLCSIRQHFPNREANAIDQFATLIKSLEITAQQQDAFTTATEVAKISGFFRSLNDDKSIEGRARIENVEELLNAIQSFVDNDENEDKSLGAFLQEVSLLTNADQQDDDSPKVTLMTIHSAKGLEFKYVYVVGMEEDLFPSQMMLSCREDLEEERRLFYVAITRAEKRVTLSYALQRYRFGNLKMCEPSRFLDEIDPKYIYQKPQKKSFKEMSFASKEDSAQKTKTRNLIKQPKAKTKSTYKASPNFKPSDPRSLTVGAKVEHRKFGFGVVTTLLDDSKATVLFDDVGSKTLLLSFAKLMVHN